MATAEAKNELVAEPINDGSFMRRAYHDHFHELVRFLRSRSHDDSTAHDLAQSTFLRLAEYEKKAEIRDPQRILFRIALWVEIDYFRQRKKSEQILSRCHREAVLNGQDARDPEAEIIFSEQLSELREIIESLPGKRREVLLLVVYKHYSFAQVAKKLRISEVNARQYYTRAVRRCRETMNRSSNPLHGQSAVRKPTNGVNGH